MPYSLCISTAFAEEAAKTFGQHTRSQWLNDINHKTEAVTRNPEPIIGSDSKIIMEQSKDQQHRQKLEGYYQNEDFDGLQTFGEHRANQLETEQSPEGEAWRLLNQSPDRYYPDANKHRILGAMELGVGAVRLPIT